VTDLLENWLQTPQYGPFAFLSINLLKSSGADISPEKQRENLKRKIVGVMDWFAVSILNVS